MLVRRAIALRSTATRLGARAMASGNDNYGVPSASDLMQDAKVKEIPDGVKKQHAGLASNDAIERTRKALEGYKHAVEVVNTGAEALAAIIKIVPKGADVTSVSSTTLVRTGKRRNSDTKCMLF